jgi:hypothetical protein
MRGNARKRHAWRGKIGKLDEAELMISSPAGSWRSSRTWLCANDRIRRALRYGFRVTDRA